MKQNQISIKHALIPALIAGLTSTASAGVLNNSPFGPSLHNTNNPFATVDGTGVHAGNAVFNDAGGAILNDADLHTLGTSESMSNALERDSTISSTVTTVGNVRTITLEWSTDGGAAMIQPGDGVGELPITTLSFELGTQNFPNAGVNDPDFLAFNHSEDGDNPGTFLADFDLLDADGDLIFAGNFFVDIASGAIAGRTFISAGGADLADFNIGGGVATMSYTIIPAPGALALLGMAGLAGATRRRRH